MPLPQGKHFPSGGSRSRGNGAAFGSQNNIFSTRPHSDKPNSYILTEQWELCANRSAFHALLGERMTPSENTRYNSPDDENRSAFQTPLTCNHPQDTKEDTLNNVLPCDYNEPSSFVESLMINCTRKIWSFFKVEITLRLDMNLHHLQEWLVRTL